MTNHCKPIFYFFSQIRTRPHTNTSCNQPAQKKFPHLDFHIKTQTTQGDNVLDKALSKIGDKGLFTKELEDSILKGETSFAVHSLKDLPTNLPKGLVVAAVTERIDPSDSVVMKKGLHYKSLKELPKGSVVGTSSLRRIAQLRHQYPDLNFQDIRGNLNTRFKKLDDPQSPYSCIILAKAGLERLGLEFSSRITQILDDVLYATGQGALGIEAAENDTEIRKLLSAINDPTTAQACRAERAFLHSLEGGCQVPIGVKSVINGENLTLFGVVLSVDGKQCIKTSVSGPLSDAENVGKKLGDTLKANGAEKILKDIRKSNQLGESNQH